MTPFADRALDRGLTGVLVALVRKLERRVQRQHAGLSDFDRNDELADHVVRYLKRRAATSPATTRPAVASKTSSTARLDQWARERGVPARRLAYDRPFRSDDVAGLLHRPEEGRWRQTTCPTSLRDVEPGIQLQLLPGATAAEGTPPFLPREGNGSAGAAS